MYLIKIKNMIVLILILFFLVAAFTIATIYISFNKEKYKKDGLM